MKFGDRLRQGREARGVTLDAVFKETRIARRYLDALERSNLEALPGGAFNRGFIRSYAKFVGFDPLPILDAYAAAERMLGGTAENEDRVLPGLPLQAERRGGPERGWPITPTTLARALLVLAIMVGGIWLLLPETSEDEPGRQAISRPPEPTEPDSPAELRSPVVEVPTAEPASPETAQEELEQSADASELDSSQLTVADAGLGTRVVEHALTGHGDRFAEGTRVFFWNRVMNGGEGMVLRHVWKLGDEMVMNSELVIGGPHWRTYSSYTLPLGATGNWTVAAIGPDGRVLSRKEFVCFDSPDLETGDWRGRLARSR